MPYPNTCKRFFGLFMLTHLLLFLSGDIPLSFGDEYVMREGKRKALLIGNSDYHESSNNLNNPGNDVDSLDSVLTNLGFEVDKKKNLTKKEMRKSVNGFVRGLKDNDVAFFFYSGHGMEIESYNYLLPVEFSATNEDDAKDDAYLLQTILSRFDNRKGLNIVIIDACRSNDFTRGWKRGTGSNGFGNMHANSGTYLAFSAGVGEAASDVDPDDTAHSPFTASLLSHLDTENIELNQVFKRVRSDVHRRTSGKQNPVSVDETLGEFYFASKETPTTIESTDETHALEKKVPVEEKAPPGWVIITAGSFQMGSPATEKGRNSNEGPAHKVTITRSFLLKETEVTQSEWQKLMGTNPSRFSKCGDECPVEQVSWWDAVTYCNALSEYEGLEQCYKLRGCKGTVGGGCDDITCVGNYKCSGFDFVGLDCKGYRLPTEAEWEYAARAQNTGSAYSTNLGDIAWYKDNSSSKTHRVGQKLPNTWGLYDMLGNVWEWTGDWYDSEYSNHPQTDPIGPKKGSSRILRGGSWDYNTHHCRLAFRDGYEPVDRNDDLGFRPARSLDPGRRYEMKE